jgi:DNA-binding GntR family transcriptional regulator
MGALQAPGLDLSFDRASTTERAAAALRVAIFEGRIAPGTPLREADLVTSLGVARSTVREALRILVAENVLSRHPNRGVAVRVLDPADLADITAARRVLELGAVAVARPEQVTTLRHALDAYEVAVAAGSARAITDAHLSFHEEIVGLAGSARLHDLGRALLTDLRLHFAAAEHRAQDAAEQLGQHRRLYRLIASGDRDGAMAEIDDHLGSRHP